MGVGETLKENSYNTGQEAASPNIQNCRGRRLAPSLPPSRRSRAGSGSRDRQAYARESFATIQNPAALGTSQFISRLLWQTSNSLSSPAVTPDPKGSEGTCVLYSPQAVWLVTHFVGIHVPLSGGCCKVYNTGIEFPFEIWKVLNSETSWASRVSSKEWRDFPWMGYPSQFTRSPAISLVPEGPWLENSLPMCKCFSRKCFRPSKILTNE